MYIKKHVLMQMLLIAFLILPQVVQADSFKEELSKRLAAFAVNKEFTAQDKMYERARNEAFEKLIVTRKNVEYLPLFHAMQRKMGMQKLTPIFELEADIIAYYIPFVYATCIGSRFHAMIPTSKAFALRHESRHPKQYEEKDKTFKFSNKAKKYAHSIGMQDTVQAVEESDNSTLLHELCVFPTLREKLGIKYHELMKVCEHDAEDFAAQETKCHACLKTVRADLKMQSGTGKNGYFSATDLDPFIAQAQAANICCKVHTDKKMFSETSYQQIKRIYEKLEGNDADEIFYEELEQYQRLLAQLRKTDASNQSLTDRAMFTKCPE